MDGLPAFNKATAKLLFGDLPALAEGRVATIQGLSVRAGPWRRAARVPRPQLRRAAGLVCGESRGAAKSDMRAAAPHAQGTGSLRLGAAFVAKFMPGRVRAAAGAAAGRRPARR